MDLRWWPIALAGVLSLAVCVVLAMVLPSPGAERTLRPLAHVDRLTALPEYARIRRRETVLAVTTIALLVVLFLTATLTAARPSSSGREFDALHPEDLMLCVGAGVEPGIAQRRDQWCGGRERSRGDLVDVQILRAHAGGLVQEAADGVAHLVVGLRVG